MATIAIQPMEAVRTTTGGPPYVLKLAEAASQTFRPGALLERTTGGFVREATSGSVTTVVGVAMEAGKALAANSDGTDAQKVAVAMAIPSNVFVANVDTTTAIADVGVSYGVEKSGNFWIVDKSTGTGTRKVLIQELDRRDAIGDTQGRVLFTFHPIASSFSYVS